MAEIEQLLEIMRRLRDRNRGCPWDLEQDFASIAPHTIEEAYEVADAIDRGAYQDLKDELGDLLFQVVFHAQMAAEAGHFEFADVVAAICEKMTDRHPHVFGDAQVEDAAAQTAAWEAFKARERGSVSDSSALAGLTRGLPEWIRAAKLNARAARVGFDWPDAGGVLEKLTEELAELREALDDGGAADRIEEELGDLLFASIALARHTGADPGRALRRANAKFERRFRALEALASARGIEVADAGLEALERLWQEVKHDAH